MKVCSKCGVAQALEDFARDRSKASGRKSLCKVCDNAKSKRYYEQHREEKLARMNERNARLREARGWRGRRRRGRPGE